MPKITLSNGEDIWFDEQDRALIESHHWFARPPLGDSSKPCYAMALVEGERIFMHRLLVPVSEGFEIDHADGDPRNNTRANLRVCTRSQNQQNRGKFKNNRSGYKGVYRDSRYPQKWRAQIRVDGKKFDVGSFESARDAAEAYNRAAKKFHGEYARVNEIA